MKISIIGYAGTGKSTFSLKLKEIHSITPIHMDQLFFNPNWEIVGKDIFQKRIDKVLEDDNWILEGNYSNFSSKRINDSDIIYIFSFNRFKSLWGVIKRRFKYNNKVRPSAAEGCYEKIDFKFVKYIMFDSRTKQRKNYYKKLITNSKYQVVVFKNQRQVNNYLKQLRYDTK